MPRIAFLLQGGRRKKCWFNEREILNRAMRTIFCLLWCFCSMIAYAERGYTKSLLSARTMIGHCLGSLLPSIEM
jgi:hypothetical protein